MMKRPRRPNRKLLSILLVLCMVLTLVPVTAFAAGDENEGGSGGNVYTHTYHTKIEATANVTIKDADGNVTETTTVMKDDGEFIKGNVSDEAVQAEIKRICDKIEEPFISRGTATIENYQGQMVLDHFEIADILDENNNDSEGVNKNSESGRKRLDVHEYQIYQITYDLIIQEDSQTAQNTITNVVLSNATLSYHAGDIPKASAKTEDDANYEIAYEYWEQMETTSAGYSEPVAYWYSDENKNNALSTDKRIKAFEGGKSYMYSIMLHAKDGFSFAETNEGLCLVLNGKDVNVQNISVGKDGSTLFAVALETIKPSKQSRTITTVSVENVKLNYQPDDTPQVTAQIAESAPNYTIAYERWEKQEKDANDILNAVAYWYSDESCYSDGTSRFNNFEKGGRYLYSLRLKAKDGYTFDSNLNEKNVTLNGASLPFGSFVNVLDDGKTCNITYGTAIRPGQVVEKINFLARTGFTEGDKPYFSNSAVDPFVDLDHERWDVNDGSGYGITSSDYWNERYNGKLITEFESGKSYTYGVYFKISDLGMEEGYRFDKNTKLYINGQEITLTPDQINVDDNGETIWFNNVLTMTPTTVKTIDVVEINNAAVSFKNGDKPVFTGKVPDGVNYRYRCEWWELDSKTGLVSTEPEWGSGIYENKITAFEAGKTYHYGVYVTAVGFVEEENVTYIFTPETKLKINGKFVNYKRYEGDTSDGSDGTMWVITDLTMAPKASGTAPEYKVIEGANSSWQQNSDGTLTFRANGEFSKFTGVKVDGQLVDAKNYTAVSGSTIVTLSADYLKTLSAGNHTLTVVFNDGDCSTNFTVQTAGSSTTPSNPGSGTGSGTTPSNPGAGTTGSGTMPSNPNGGTNGSATTPSGSSGATGSATTAGGTKATGTNTANLDKAPKTGEDSPLALWIGVLCVSAFGMVGTTVYTRKKKYSK